MRNRLRHAAKAAKSEWRFINWWVNSTFGSWLFFLLIVFSLLVWVADL